MTGRIGMTGPHALYRTVVHHARLRPFRHAFRYRIWTLLLDIDRLDRLPAPLRWNRPGLLSFQDRDHGARDGSPLRPWVEAQLRARGVEPPGGRIRLLCLPRILGHTFNPLSVYYCDDPQGRLAAILYEVKNTFGDQHPYACAVAPEDGERIIQTHAKEFHVSPFFGMDGGYRFRLLPPGERMAIDIRYGDEGGDLLVATLSGKGQPLTGGAVLRALLSHPFVTLKVVAGIHWEALKLWRKGARFHRRPEPAVRLSGPTPLAAAQTGPTLSAQRLERRPDERADQQQRDLPDLPPTGVPPHAADAAAAGGGGECPDRQPDHRAA